MALDRIVVVALVNRSGAVLLRTRDERSTVRSNRWSLPGGGANEAETPHEAGVRMVREQAKLAIEEPLRLVWHGRLPDPLAEVFFFAGTTRATSADLPSDPVPGAIDRFGEFELRFFPGGEVLSGRSFTPVTGYVIGDFMSSRLYRELAAGSDPDALA